MRRFLQRLAALSPSEWDAAARAFAAREGSAPFTRADRALAASLAAAGRESEKDAALRPLAQLVQLAEPEDAAADDATANDDPPTMHAVAPAAVAAVLALVARDLVPAPVFDTLYAPFADAIPVDRLG